MRSPEKINHLKTPKDYLSSLDPRIAESFTEEQLKAVKHLLKRAITKPSPKLVDLRFTVDLVFSRFYIVLFVGKDRRTQKRFYFQNKLVRMGNSIAAVILLIGVNLVISASLILVAYLIKSAIGVDIFANQHISDVLKMFE